MRASLFKLLLTLVVVVVLLWTTTMESASFRLPPADSSSPSPEVTSSPSPSPSPSPKPTPSASERCKKKHGHNRCIAIKYWKGDDERMLQVFECESGFNERAQNSCCRGIAQLHEVHSGRARRMGYTWGQMYDPGKNVKVAWDLFVDQGWGPWECA